MAPDEKTPVSRIDWIIRANLEERLNDWAREYAGPIVIGRQGAHVLAKLIEFGGFLPGSTAPRSQVDPTPADEIEAIVRRMTAAFPVNALVLRCDYWYRETAMPLRLELLGRAGAGMSKAAYFNNLTAAKLYVAGAL